MITFNILYEALRKEKYNDSLQLLPKKFLQESQEYFNEKKEFLNKENNIFSDLSIKTKKKLENAYSSLTDLLRLRKKKILNLAFIASEVGISKKDFENMLDFEKDLFQSIVKALEKAQKDKESEMNKTNNNNLLKHRLIRFLEDVPEFLDFEGEEIGPFEKGEIANLEQEIIELLINDKKAELIDEDY
ncbi:MAG: hypothetical protein WC260_00570 [Candidatus Pacearchaeota archaeon]